MKTFTPPSKSPTEKWVFSSGRKSNYNAPPTKWVKRVTSTNAQKEMSDSKKFAYNNNYKGKNLMTKNQWRRFQRQKKTNVLKDITNTEKGKEKRVAAFEVIRKPATEKIFSPLSESKENFTKEDDKMTSNFNSSEANFDVICVVSIFPVEYGVTSEINEDEGDFTEEMAVHKPLCYYVMDNGCVEGEHAMFAKPDHHMKSHLKPLFVQAKINNVGINKVLINGGAVANLLPQFLLKKIGLSKSDLKPHNVILFNYERKSRSSLGAVEVDLVVGTVKRSTIFLVVASKAYYNLLLGREWVHGVSVVPSTMHQRLTLWKEDGVLENIEADHSYFLAEVDTIFKKTFDKQLAKIAPCAASELGYEDQDNFLWSMKLDPEDGFTWKKEITDEGSILRTRASAYSKASIWGRPGIPPTGWEDNDD